MNPVFKVLPRARPKRGQLSETVGRPHLHGRAVRPHQRWPGCRQEASVRDDTQVFQASRQRRQQERGCGPSNGRQRWWCQLQPKESSRSHHPVIQRQRNISPSQYLYIIVCLSLCQVCLGTSQFWFDLSPMPTAEIHTVDCTDKKMSYHSKCYCFYVYKNANIQAPNTRQENLFWMVPEKFIKT